MENVRIPDELGDWLVRSEDGGRTWSFRIPTLVNSPHGPVERADGTLLYAGKRTAPSAARTRGSPHESQGAAVAVSRDDGRTWTLEGEIPCAPGHKPGDYHELHAVECPGGRLVAQIRNHGEPWKGETIQTESDDGGLTWSVPHSIGVWGTPSHLLRLRDGRVLMTYGYRQAPFGNQARLSRDGGRTWSDPLVLSDDGAGVDLGYPSTAELDDGTLVSVWYEAMPGNPLAVLRQARWRLATR
jgi:sialidase-1